MPSMCSLDTAKERLFELEDISIEASKTESQKEKRYGGNPRPVGQLQRSNARVIGIDSPRLPPLLMREPQLSPAGTEVVPTTVSPSMLFTLLSTLPFLLFHSIQIILGLDQRHLIPTAPAHTDLAPL